MYSKDRGWGFVFIVCTIILVLGMYYNVTVIREVREAINAEPRNCSVSAVSRDVSLRGYLTDFGSLSGEIWSVLLVQEDSRCNVCHYAPGSVPSKRDYRDVRGQHCPHITYENKEKLKGGINESN